MMDNTGTEDRRDGPPSSPADQAQLGQLCTKVAKVIDALCAGDHGLSVGQLNSLLVVSLHPGLTITDLARVAGIPLATASRHAARLGTSSGLGLLHADISRDARLKPLRLTRKGAMAVRSAAQALLQ